MLRSVAWHWNLEYVQQSVAHTHAQVVNLLVLIPAIYQVHGVGRGTRRDKCHQHLFLLQNIFFQFYSFFSLKPDYFNEMAAPNILWLRLATFCWCSCKFGGMEERVFLEIGNQSTCDFKAGPPLRGRNPTAMLASVAKCRMSRPNWGETLAQSLHGLVQPS